LPDVAAGIDDEAVQPRRELRFTAELLDPYAELRERLLRGVLRVLRIRKKMSRKPLHARGVPSADRFECALVTVFRSRDQNRIAEPLVRERGFRRKLTPDSTAATAAGLHAGLV
jgi:hypothetical protein